MLIAFQLMATGVSGICQDAQWHVPPTLVPRLEIVSDHFTMGSNVSMMGLLQVGKLVMLCWDQMCM